jgi:protein-disulfide isomerase
VNRFRGFFVLAIAALAIGVALFAVGHRWQEARAARAVGENAEQIFRSPESFVAGNPRGDVSVVAFYDHNCPYCREGAPALAKPLPMTPRSGSCSRSCRCSVPIPRTWRE